MRNTETTLWVALELSRELVANTDLETLLHRIASIAQELTETESAGILLQDEGTQELYFVVVTTFPNVILHRPVPLNRSIAGASFTSDEAIIVPDVRSDPRYFPRFADLTGIAVQSLLAVPMAYQQQRIGVIEVQNKRDGSPFDEGDVRILTTLAAYATIAIQNARFVRTLMQHQEHLETEVAAQTEALRTRNAQLQQEITEREQAQQTIIEQQRTLAAFEERERMGSDLHDGLGQVLGYINLESQTALTLLRQHQLPSVQASLERLAQVAQDAHADVRSFIFGLRVATAKPGDLYDAVRAYLDQFNQAHGTKATLSSPPGSPAPALTPAVEEQVLRIIQEALANARKHAHTDDIQVTFSLTPSHLHVIITDNGRGFNVQQTASELGVHFGLNIMRERAQRVGGQVEVRSSPGEGTQVLLTVPQTAGNQAAEPDDLARVSVQASLVLTSESTSVSCS